MKLEHAVDEVLGSGRDIAFGEGVVTHFDFLVGSLDLVGLKGRLSE